jgi:hypothetical protein
MFLPHLAIRREVSRASLDMKNRLLRRLLWSAAFTVGLAVPLAASHSPAAEAFQACSLTSGSDSWTGFNADGSSFTVSVSYDTGVSATGTLPSLASLPVVLTSLNGHRLAISADVTGARVYEGTFASTMPVSCSCPNMGCDAYSHSCVPAAGMSCSISSGGGCTSTTCGGGGASISNFKAAF